MTKNITTLLLILLTFQLTVAQTKQRIGKKDSWFDHIAKLQKTLVLKDLETSKDEFNFRCWNFGQVVEITKDSSIVKGTITSYIDHWPRWSRKKTKIIFSKSFLTEKDAKIALNVIENSGILAVQSDEKIENWPRGADGMYYTIESSNKNTYSFKTYWSPRITDSVPETKIVSNFLKNLNDTLHLAEKQEIFKNKLPKIGCYPLSVGSTLCYTRNTFTGGYSGTTKLPFGFLAIFYTNEIINLDANLQLALEYNFDNRSFYHLNFNASSSGIFFEPKSFTDFISFNYQNRRIDIHKLNNTFENHQLKYGFFLKRNISFGIGLDYLINESRKLGGYFYASKGFAKPNINIILNSSIFANQINYKIDLQKSFQFKYRYFINQLIVGIAYEEFMTYKDFQFKAAISF